MSDEELEMEIDDERLEKLLGDMAENPDKKRARGPVPREMYVPEVY